MDCQPPRFLHLNHDLPTLPSTHFDALLLAADKSGSSTIFAADFLDGYDTFSIPLVPSLSVLTGDDSTRPRKSPQLTSELTMEGPVAVGSRHSTKSPPVFYVVYLATVSCAGNVDKKTHELQDLPRFDSSARCYRPLSTPRSSCHQNGDSPVFNVRATRPPRRSGLAVATGWTDVARIIVHTVLFEHLLRSRRCWTLVQVQDIEMEQIAVVYDWARRCLAALDVDVFSYAASMELEFGWVDRARDMESAKDWFPSCLLVLFTCYCPTSPNVFVERLFIQFFF
ncbi:hypothetical protein B0H16DRAFT_1715440 [Mycena metata]|uniref:Uncharacterized protein n=1 Tax=Mycena metata TaxID=1033252 RepID=A0AAD7JQI1_9AGAR|nr:hypothetical protein B0H16DRAFT_1715440 [Mycena metata]